ncbi:MAG: cupin domain-containing protein [Clostridia bacterium]
MYFDYKDSKGIKVPQPFSRTIIPLFMGDTSKYETNFSVHITEWEPGCKIDLHAHPVGMEAMYCMSGEGKAFVDGKEYNFVSDTMIIAAPGKEHYIENTGATLLKVLCVFSPPIIAKALEERALQAVENSKK